MSRLLSVTGSSLDGVSSTPESATPLGSGLAQHRGPRAEAPPALCSVPTLRERRRAARGLWVALALACLVVLAPLELVRLDGWHAHRSFAAELGSGLGITALGVLSLQGVLPARLRAFSGLGADAAVRLHRHLAEVLLWLVLAHVAVAIAADPRRMGLLRIVGDPVRAKAAFGSVFAMAALAATSLARRRLRLGYALWRGLHAALAAVAVALVVVHTAGWGRYLLHGGGPLAFAALAGGPLVAIAVLRVLRPRSATRASYVVERVVAERGRTTSIVLRAEGHAGRPFRPGQFAWLKLADAPTSLAEHPFSYASSAEHPERPSFTIRNYAGFSARAAHLAPGTRVLVDGPHGGYCPRRDSRGVVLVASGIGITPSMSILRTAADRGDTRRFVLFYANREEEGITFREELGALEARLDLEVVHVISRPGPEWAGERGRLTTAVLHRHLPPDLRRWEFFLCGAPAPVDSASLALAQLGIPPERLHAERFVEV